MQMLTYHFLRAQFARRDSVYYQSISAKSQDAFVIVCTITSTSSPTTLLPSGSNLSVPKTLIDTVGSLLDDPLYSDVEFVIMRHTRNSQNARRIWASRKILQRAEHFNDSACGNLGRFLLANKFFFKCLVPISLREQWTMPCVHPVPPNKL